MKDQQLDSSRLFLHLKYIVIIFILVCCTVGGMALYNQDFAINSLSAASLLTSIVLAVVAILITLWDVAGQKSNILIMQENLNSFREIILQFKTISEDNEISINELKDVVMELNQNVSSYESKFAQIEKKIEEHGNDTLKQELEEIINQRNKPSVVTGIRNNRGISISEVRKSLNEKFSPEQPISLVDLIKFLTQSQEITMSTARRLINTLVEKKILDTKIKTIEDEEGSYTITEYYLK